MSIVRSGCHAVVAACARRSKRPPAAPVGPLHLLPGRLARAARRLGLTGLAVAVVWTAGTQGTQDAVANGDTRTLSIRHTHTGESATITFRRNGQYDERGLEQLNWLLRDWRRDEATRMDPRLFDTVWEMYREVGSSEPIHVVSAYRSPQTNSMLRRRSSGVAENSQHMRGKAMDFFLPDVPVDRIRAVGMRLQDGGVGYYPTSGRPFIHLDVGSVRAWPRMTRDQLVRLFPDGKTVHLPADGKPLPGYEEARAEVLARGGTVAGLTAVAEATPRTSGRSFWATLFGSDEEEDIAESRVARSAPLPSRPVLASAYVSDQDSSPSAVLRSYNEQRAEPRIALAAVRTAPPRLDPPEAPIRVASLPSNAELPEAPLRTASLPARPEAAEAPARRPDTAVASEIKDLPEPVDRRAVALPAAPAVLPPLPPQRPDDIVATGTLASGASGRRESLAALNAALPAVLPPLPPVRPQPRLVQVASVGPVAIAPAVTPAPPPPRAATGRAEDRAALGALFSQVATAQAPVEAGAAKVAARTPADAVLSAKPALATGFSTKAAGELSTHRFSGPAVRPLAAPR